jgi:hypothetical protein
MTLCLLVLQPVLAHCPALIRYICDCGKPVVSSKEEKCYDFERNLSQRYYMHHKSHTDCRTQLTALRSRQLIDLLSCGKATTSMYCGGYDKKHCVDDLRRSVNTVMNLRVS